MPITNIVIVLFLLAMTYFGSVNGLFSSFLQLMVVITVGTIAFAIWEPLTLGLLMKYIPLMAWAVGLLVPFGLLLIIFRLVVDKLVPRNMEFVPIVNTLLGAACGAISGVLTAGIAIIGLGLLPFGADMGGFQPYAIGAGGAVVKEGGSDLWVPVHRITAKFFSGLSAGAFSTSTPMAEYMPDLDVQVSLVRMRPDNVSIVAAPDAVEVTGASIVQAGKLTDASPATAEALGPDFRKPGYKLVIVDTEWSKKEGTVDGDRALRVPASQVRLVTKSGKKGVEMIGPVGFSKPKGDQRVFYPYDSDAVLAFSVTPTSSFSWVFLVPADQTPMFLIIRKLRLNLPASDQVNTKPGEVLAALGTPPVPKPEQSDQTAEGSGAAAAGPTVIGDRNGIRAGTYALDLQITSMLPSTVSKNASTGLSLTESEQGAVIDSGSTGSARKIKGNIGKRSRIIGFNIPSHEAMVRVRIEPDQAVSLFGAARASAAALNPIFLKDTDGNKWFVSAWVWLKENKDQEIHYDAFNTIRSAKQLPISRMNKGDEFYLYFTVTKPAQIVSYNIGDVTDQPFEPPLKVE